MATTNNYERQRASEVFHRTAGKSEYDRPAGRGDAFPMYLWSPTFHHNEISCGRNYPALSGAEIAIRSRICPFRVRNSHNLSRQRANPPPLSHTIKTRSNRLFYFPVLSVGCLGVGGVQDVTGRLCVGARCNQPLRATTRNRHHSCDFFSSVNGTRVPTKHAVLAARRLPIYSTNVFGTNGIQFGYVFGTNGIQFGHVFGTETVQFGHVFDTNGIQFGHVLGTNTIPVGYALITNTIQRRIISSTCKTKTVQEHSMIRQVGVSLVYWQRRYMTF